MTSAKKNVTILHYGLDMRPETLAGLRHGGLQYVGHHLHELRHQRGDSVVRGFVNIPLKNAAGVQKATFGNKQHGHCRMDMSMPHAA
jgi:hypothetical protein